MLTACAAPSADRPTARAISGAIALPAAVPLAALMAPMPPARLRSNPELARDFMDLSFQLESGRALPFLTRFEGPVTIRTTGAVPASAEPELAGLIARLRHEAGIDVRLAGADTTATEPAITVQFLPKRAMQAQVPNAACFVVPNVTGWAEYKRARRSDRIDWARLTSRARASVFIPSDAAPQEVRDCLHEEIAQALGPLNDLYRLPDTVFNDDNFHTVLTDFDMTILRIYYAPELHSGQTADEAAARLPAILARINPGGGTQAAAPAPDDTPRAFVTALEQAMSARTGRARRVTAAREAVAIASREGWSDSRAGFAWFALGRLLMAEAPATAMEAFLRAGAIYRGTPGAAVPAAHVDMQLAAFALSAGRAQDALALANRALGPAAGAQNAALLATLQLIRAEAYQTLGRADQARQARLDSAGWARYGFGSEAAVRRRAAEVAALARAGARTN